MFSRLQLHVIALVQGQIPPYWCNFHCLWVLSKAQVHPAPKTWLQVLSTSTGGSFGKLLETFCVAASWRTPDGTERFGSYCCPISEVLGKRSCPVTGLSLSCTSPLFAGLSDMMMLMFTSHTFYLGIPHPRNWLEFRNTTA